MSHAGGGHFSAEDLDNIKRTLAENRNVAEVAAIVRSLLQQTPPAERLALVAHVCEAHPFYAPQLSAADLQALNVDPDGHRKHMLSARVTAAALPAARVLVACPPKSASSFLVNALGDALSTRHVSLTSTSYTARASSVLGANLREQEIDEAALLRHCLAPEGFVAQHHVRGTPYLGWLLEANRVQPIVTTRNLFDSLVSFDDMLCKGRGPGVAPGHFFSDAMPGDYALLPFEHRLDVLMERWLFWYVQFLAGWRQIEPHCALKPVWISYERDVLAGNAHLAKRFAAEVPALAGKEAELLAALDRVNDAAALRNKGIAGRGSAVPETLRARALRLIERYAAEIDLSPLLDEPPENASVDAA